MSAITLLLLLSLPLQKVWQSHTIDNTTAQLIIRICANMNVSVNVNIYLVNKWQINDVQQPNITSSAYYALLCSVLLAI